MEKNTLSTGQHETMPVKRLSVGQEVACQMTGLGRSKLLQLAYGNEIRSYKVGKRRLFPVESLEQWVRDQVKASEPFPTQVGDAPIPGVETMVSVKRISQADVSTRVPRNRDSR